MKIISAREFHKNPGHYQLKYDEINVLVRRNKPVCVLTPIREDDFYQLRLDDDIRLAMEEIKNGKSFSHEEVSEKFIGEMVSMAGAFHTAVYAKRAINDLEMAGAKYQEKILKKIYEKCHFREPFDAYFDEYMQIRAGKYVVICKPDERRADSSTINILCIYPPNGSLKERFRL